VKRGGVFPGIKKYVIVIKSEGAFHDSEFKQYENAAHDKEIGGAVHKSSQRIALAAMP